MWGLDIVGPLRNAPRGYTHLLVVVDKFSKWIEELTQNQHLAPSTQQAEQCWLNTRAGSEACQSIFLKLTKDEK
jgi:hypothetical protein